MSGGRICIVISSLGGSLARNLPFGGVSNYELLNTENTNLSSLIERFENNGFIEHFRRHRRDIQIDLNPAFSKQYYDVDEFNLKFSSTNCGLTICHINVRRIAKNKGRLIAFLSSITRDFDILLLTEIGDNADGFLINNFKEFLVIMICLC